VHCRRLSRLALWRDLEGGANVEIGVQFLQEKNRAVISYEYQAVYGVWAGHLQPLERPYPGFFCPQGQVARNAR
jgi:hypothetical protein